MSDRDVKPRGITPADLDRWEALAGALPTGPWVIAEGGFSEYWGETIDAPDRSQICLPLADGAGPFIAEARSAVPALCAEVRRLRELAQRAVDALLPDLSALTREEWQVLKEAAEVVGFAIPRDASGTLDSMSAEVQSLRVERGRLLSSMRLVADVASYQGEEPRTAVQSEVLRIARSTLGEHHGKERT